MLLFRNNPVCYTENYRRNITEGFSRELRAPNMPQTHLRGHVAWPSTGFYYHPAWANSAGGTTPRPPL